MAGRPAKMARGQSGRAGGSAGRGILSSFGIGQPQLTDEAQSYIHGETDQAPNQLYNQPGFWSRLFNPSAANAATSANLGFQGELASGQAQRHLMTQEDEDRVNQLGSQIAEELQSQNPNLSDDDAQYQGRLQAIRLGSRATSLGTGLARAGTSTSEDEAARSKREEDIDKSAFDVTRNSQIDTRVANQLAAADTAVNTMQQQRQILPLVNRTQLSQATAAADPETLAAEAAANKTQAQTGAIQAGFNKLLAPLQAASTAYKLARPEPPSPVAQVLPTITPGKNVTQPLVTWKRNPDFFPDIGRAIGSTLGSGGMNPLQSPFTTTGAFGGAGMPQSPNVRSIGGMQYITVTGPDGKPMQVPLGLLNKNAQPQSDDADTQGGGGF